MFGSEIQTIKKHGIRRFLLQALRLVSALTSCLVMWKALCLATNCTSPIVVVLSESMEPAFQRGDILFLSRPASPTTPYLVGDITVYKTSAATPIVHRVIEVHDLPDADPPDQLLLTKGDNNPVDDIDLYEGEMWIKRKNIVGRVRGFLPYVGYATIAINDFPQLKFAVIGGVGIYSLLQ